MKRIIRFQPVLFVFAVLTAGLLPAQEEQAARSSEAASRYWTAPRVEQTPPAGQRKPVPAVAGQPLTIENETLRVTWNPAGLEMVYKPSGSVFLNDGSFNLAGGAGKIISVTDKTFGQGQEIEFSNPDGSSDAVMLFPNLPFVLLRSSLINNSTQTAVVSHVRPFQAAVKLGRPAGQLKTLGSAGLLAPDRNPGSYEWLTVAEPQTRNGVVFGWLTDERGSGVLFDKTNGDVVRVGAQIDYGRLVIAPGQSSDLETLAVGYFDDARLGLESFADAIARNQNIHLPPEPTVYCTWYSQPYGGSSDEEHFAENVAFAKTNLAPFGFSVAQIDDHWQSGISTNGPKRGFLESAPAGPYPHGMKATADDVKSLGLKPGLWFIPFAGTYYDPIFTNHPDWFTKHADGSPYAVKWGGTCFDLTNPDARNYISNVVHRITQEWGYEYIKIDGLWTGTGTKIEYVNSGYVDDNMGDAVFQDPTKSNIENYRSGLRLVRQAAGPNTFILGCNSPQNMRTYGGTFGLVDGMRIGPDNKATWSAMLRGPTFGSRNYFLNGRVWYNDPDPIYVRTNVPLNEARALCSWVAISGAMNTSSEWYPGLSPERLDLLRRTMPAHGLLSVRPVDIFENDPPQVWLLTELTSPAIAGNIANVTRDVIGLFNWSDDEKPFDYPLAKIGLDPNLEYVAFDYWQNKLLPPFRDNLKISVPAHSCCILAARAALDYPEVISTSRHITQGAVDALDERWDAATKTLSGRSQVVGGDAYELRIVAGNGAKISGVSASELNGPEIKSSFTQDGNLIRVKLEPSSSAVASWSVKFQ